MASQAEQRNITALPHDGNHLCLLALDGGGVRGLSSLLILRAIMAKVNEGRSKAKEKLPCEMFDVIGGTSTGGLIAIMLGRLAMDVETCIKKYTEMFEGIFKNKVHKFPVKWNGDIQPLFSSKALEEAITKVVISCGINADAKFNDGNPRGCHTFVCTTVCESTATRLFRDYNLPGEPNDDLDVTIVQAALATSAASTFFDAVQIDDRFFRDGATGANNPILHVWEEAQNIWVNKSGKLDDILGCILSVGTGNPGMEPLYDKSWDFVKSSLVAIATNTERQAEHFGHNHRYLLEQPQRYHRFNVEQGLQNVGLEEYLKSGIIKVATEGYLSPRKRKTEISDCAEILKKKNSATPLFIKLSLENPILEKSVPVLLKAWLQPFEVDTITDQLHHDTCHLKNTCSWFTNSTTYTTWKNSSLNLCILGLTGTGKSTLMSRVKMDITYNLSDVVLLDYFCQLSASDARNINGTKTIIRTFLHQLSTAYSATQHILAELSKTYPDLDQVSFPTLVDKLFLVTLRHLPVRVPIYILIDGWDQMGQSDNNRSEQKEFMRLCLHRMPKDKQVSFMFTTRSRELLYYPNNIQLKEIAETDTEEDMRKYVTEELGGTGQKHLIDLIVKKSKGAFLWTKFVLRDLEHKHTTEDKTKLLEGIPNDLSKYYETHISKLEGQIGSESKSMAIGRAILGWVILATSPLTLGELQSVLLDFGHVNDLKTTIPTICGPFIRITERSTVSAEHVSVIRFFLEDAQQPDKLSAKGLRFNTGEMYLEMLRVCCKTLLGVRDRNALLSYASWNLAKHLTLAAAFPNMKGEFERYMNGMAITVASTIVNRIKQAAVTEFNKSQLAEAEKLLLGAKTFAERKFGSKGDVTLFLLAEIGKIYARQERFKEAAECSLKRAKILEEKNAPPQDLVDCLIFAAESLELMSDSDLKRAEKLRRKALIPSEHKRTLQDWKAVMALACNLEAQKKFPEAKVYVTACNAALASKEFSDDDYTIREESTLFYERIGGPKSATLVAFSAMWKEEEATRGVDSQSTMIRKWYVAYLEMEDERNWEKSDKLWGEIVQWKERTDGETYTTSMAALVKSWAWTCKKHQRWDKAQEIAMWALEIAEKSYPADSLAMGGHFLILGDIERARSLEDAAAGHTEESAEAMRLAVEHYEKGVKIHRETLGEQHNWTLGHVKTLQEIRDGHALEAGRPEAIHPYVSREKRTRREWRSVKDSAEREIYHKV